MSSGPNPSDAQPGKGAAGNQWAVQTAQPTDVNDPEEWIPSGADVELNIKQIKADGEQELAESGDFQTADGYTLDEAGQMNNFAVEPPMYVEE